MKKIPPPPIASGLKRLQAVLKWRGFPDEAAQDGVSARLTELERLAEAIAQRFDHAADDADRYLSALYNEETVSLAELLSSSIRAEGLPSSMATLWENAARCRAEAWKAAAESVEALHKE